MSIYGSLYISPHLFRAKTNARQHSLLQRQNAQKKLNIDPLPNEPKPLARQEQPEKMPEAPPLPVSRRSRVLGLDTIPENDEFSVAPQATLHSEITPAPLQTEAASGEMEMATPGKGKTTKLSCLSGFLDKCFNLDKQAQRHQMTQQTLRKVRATQAQEKALKKQKAMAAQVQAEMTIQSRKQYFEQMTALRGKLLSKKQPAALIQGSYQQGVSETVGQLPTLIRQADIRLSNGKRYHLFTEELAEKTSKAESHQVAYPAGTLLKLELSGKESAEKLTHEIWPNPQVIQEKNSYVSEQGETFSRNYAQLKHSVAQSQQTQSDLQLRKRLFQPLHALLTQNR